MKFTVRKERVLGHPDGKDRYAIEGYVIDLMVHVDYAEAVCKLMNMAYESGIHDAMEKTKQTTT